MKMQFDMRIRNLLFLSVMASATTALAGEVSVVPDKHPGVVIDRQDAQIPDREQLSGMVGSRIQNSAINRLLPMDVDRLLEGFRKRPGRQSYDGEHVGKWLHAATLAWVYTGNAQLRAKIDNVAKELLKCQLEDGYLGTYLPKEYWTDWDVWSHKYDLIGLLTYARYTGNTAPLAGCRKIGDLLCKTFGDEPGQRDIIQAGWHLGMAPTSVLEPMVWLYRLTGDKKYGDFCKYILRAWEHPNGPHIVSRLLEGKGVNKVGNGKAYEMLSCINGLLEWYRTTGDPRYLQAAINAWQDIEAKRLYITGTASAGEVFHGDYELANTGSVGETCVTVTWLQLNAHLLRLTGQARYADELERIVYNQLCGAQRPDGRAWGYYVEMEGKKPYTSTLDGQCCLSSGPRGFALVPTFAITTDADGAVVNFYDAGQAKLRLHDGTNVKLTIKTQYPASGKITIAVDPAKAREFSLKLRIPAWHGKVSLHQLFATPVNVKNSADGYATIRRTWNQGDKVELDLKLEPRLVLGEYKNQNKAAVLYGPLVLAADSALTGGKAVNSLKLASANLTDLAVTAEPAPEQMKTWPGAQAFCITAMTRKTAPTIRIRLVPFADAGATGSHYRVWLPLPPTKDSPESDNLLEDGTESRSRAGNADGSIFGGGFVVTFNGQSAKEDWYAVALDHPVTVGSVAFRHGKTFHDGGWFDTSAGKPKVQIQATKDGAWKTVGELADYPATTATDSANLAEGAAFRCKLAEPVEAVAVRVVGKPACGDAPQQAFSSCGGLRALPR
jgi:DUF1680 family protein